MSSLWLKDFPGSMRAPDSRAVVAPGLTLWQSIDSGFTRAYLAAGGAPDRSWTLLEELQSLDGASAGTQPSFHYVVETDVDPVNETEFNAWYVQEHLPGLANVPGTIRAVRYRRASGSPKYLACYDLISPETLQRREWLAVRHTDWSARVRPLFMNTRRTMFRLPETSFPSESR